MCLSRAFKDFCRHSAWIAIRYFGDRRRWRVAEHDKFVLYALDKEIRVAVIVEILHNESSYDSATGSWRRFEQKYHVLSDWIPVTERMMVQKQY